MRIAELLEIETPLPSDPAEALLATRARMELLQKRTLEVMTTLYADYPQCIAYLCNLEERLTRQLGGISAQQEGIA